VSRAFLFIDRDGTLIEEPEDEQVDALEKLKLCPGVIEALVGLRRAGFVLVLVSNQDGLGTPSFPAEAFRRPHDFMRELFGSQGIEFEQELICPHLPSDGCDCRKPRVGLFKDFIAANEIDPERSFVIGDRDSDLELAKNLGLPGIRIDHASSDDDWPSIYRRLTSIPRRASIKRTTKETDIEVRVDLDDASRLEVSTGLGFFDHMLEQIAKHGGFSLQLRCQGDLRIDEHHTVEDTALALGEALRRALGSKSGIGRYGFTLPMDESLAQAAIDLSGRSYFVFEGEFGRDSVGELPTELVSHFFRSLADSLGAALHLSVKGENTHHMIEACFKVTGRALRHGFRVAGNDLPTTKGVL